MSVKTIHEEQYKYKYQVFIPGVQNYIKHKLEQN